MRIKKVKFIN